MKRNFIPRPAIPLLARFVGKFVLDIMPAAMASVIGGFLLTQYQFGHTPASKPVLEAVTPASTEMLAMVRDEHAVIIDYLKAQTAAEKGKLAAETTDARTADAHTADVHTADAANTDAGAKPATKSADLRQALDASAHRVAVLPRPAPLRAKAIPVLATSTDVPHEPLVIAQAEQSPPADATPAHRLASDPNSLLGKTLDFKDHVVDATSHAVSAIGDVITSMGDHIGSIVTGGRQFTSASDGGLPTACAKVGEGCGF
ncbi:MAG TPA: hypothetical protein VH206_07460 [Xanthobacteraceae bacterium]|nr:hypothetical protein [Xanthobacteraceae bacterium]